MPKKNDISAFTGGNANQQKRILTPPKDEEVKLSPRSDTRGRKPKPEGEKESAVVALKLTEAEKETLTKRAGREPVATFLKRFLREETDLLG